MKTKATASRRSASSSLSAREPVKSGAAAARGKSDVHGVFQPLRTASGFDVKNFCRRYRVVRPDLTRMTGYSLRIVDKWAAGDKPGAPAQKQLKELVRLFDALAEIMEPDYVGEWLKTPNDAFEGSTPLQVIERGETDRLWRMIYIVETGEPV